MASNESDEKNLLETAEQEADVSMTTEEVKDTGGQSSVEHDRKEAELENNKDDVEIKDVKLKINDLDPEDVVIETKEDSANEKTVLINNDSSSSSESEDDVDFMDVNKNNMDDRIDDMTRRYFTVFISLSVLKKKSSYCDR